ncbi:MAG: hypothetical protein AB7I30_06590 [Isosphaeraceae bacterium]
MKRTAFLIASISSLLVTEPGRAQLIISGGSAAVVPGGVGTVDFLVESSGSDNLASFNLKLLIETTSGGSLLRFTEAQPDFSLDPNYVFVMNSTLGPNFWGPPFQTNTINDTITGFDLNSAANGPGYSTITSSTSFLLARVRFQTAAGASLGDSFTISLVNDPGQTFFLDDQFNDVNYSVSGPATISVVPEPSPWAMAGLVVLAGACRVWRSERHLRGSSGL